MLLSSTVVALAAVPTARSVDAAAAVTKRSDFVVVVAVFAQIQGDKGDDAVSNLALIFGDLVVCRRRRVGALSRVAKDKWICQPYNFIRFISLKSQS